MTVSTCYAWADALGIWHARVETVGVGSDRTAAAMARAEVLTALAEREGPNFAPSSVRLELTQRTGEHGTLTHYYREVTA